MSLTRNELSGKLERAIGFFYGNFIHGARRCVIDGVEPIEREADSFQFHIIDYVYHQILHKEHDWLARELFRAGYRAQAEQVAAHAYDHTELATMLLLTSHEVLLDDLLGRKIVTGDLLSGANTIIYMGKVRHGDRLRRALHVANIAAVPATTGSSPSRSVNKDSFRSSVGQAPACLVHPGPLEKAGNCPGRSRRIRAPSSVEGRREPALLP